MKPFEMQSYYELLEVPVSATSAQIKDAYERLVQQYGDEQVALYGLAEPAQANCCASSRLPGWMSKNQPMTLFFTLRIAR